MSAPAPPGPGTTLRVDVWMDFCCPACYLAEPRLDRAVAAEGGAARITVVRHSFELLPDVDDTRVDSFGYVLHKYGGDQAAAERHERGMARLAGDQGQEYRLHRPSSNGFHAHRFLHLAQAHGQGDAFFVRLQRDLFTEAVDIYDTAYLVETATRLGVPAEEAEATARTDAYADAVRADRRTALRAGVTGVPFTVFDHRLAIPGVATADAYRDALRAARQDKEQTV